MKTPTKDFECSDPEYGAGIHNVGVYLSVRLFSSIFVVCVYRLCREYLFLINQIISCDRRMKVLPVALLLFTKFVFKSKTKKNFRNCEVFF